MASVAEEPYQRISHWIPPDTILCQQEDKNHKTTSSLRQQFLPVISMTPESTMTGCIVRLSKDAIS